MSVPKASLLRRAALTLAACAAIALPSASQADILGGLSIRVGGFVPTNGAVRDITDIVAWGGGVEYKVPWVPHLFTGEAWSTSLSVDFHYSQRGRTGPPDTTRIYRYIPVSINQVYTFEEQNGKTPYMGFSLTAATFGAGPRTRNGVANPGFQPMVTRPGAGVILGVNWTDKIYLEGRYEWIHGGEAVKPEGLRAYIGLRF